jgi:hypothetical protein
VLGAFLLGAFALFAVVASARALMLGAFELFAATCSGALMLGVHVLFAVAVLALFSVVLWFFIPADF